MYNVTCPYSKDAAKLPLPAAVKSEFFLKGIVFIGTRRKIYSKCLSVSSQRFKTTFPPRALGAFDSPSVRELVCPLDRA
jgi:hypothetical protein